jgi:hypothetical protein
LSGGQTIPFHVNPVVIPYLLDEFNYLGANHLLVSENDLDRTKTSLFVNFFSKVENRSRVFTTRELNTYRVKRVVDVADSLPSSLYAVHIKE